MTRKTSIDAYNTIKANGLLSKLEWEVYDFVYQNQPCSMRDLLKAISTPNSPATNYSSRFAKLRRVGVFEELPKQKDPDTGHTVLMWGTTDKLPKIEKLTAEQKLINQIRATDIKRAELIRKLSALRKSKLRQVPDSQGNLF